MMRGFLVGVLVILGLVAVPLADLGIWTRRSLLDTTSFVTLANDVVQEHDVRAALVDRIAEEIVTGAPRLEGSRAVVEQGASAALGSPAFQTIFAGAATQMHAQLDRGDDELVLDLNGVLPLVRDALVPIDARVSELIPVTELPPITVVRQDSAPALWRGVDITRTLSWALPALTLALLAAAVALARRRGRTLIVVGIGVIVMAIGVVALLRVGRGVVSDAVGTQLSTDAFDAAWDTITSSLITQTLVVGVVGVLAAAGGALAISRTTGNRRPTDWA
jgi:hypothetical protein